MRMARQASKKADSATNFRVNRAVSQAFNVANARLPGMFSLLDYDNQSKTVRAHLIAYYYSI